MCSIGWSRVTFVVSVYGSLPAKNSSHSKLNKSDRMWLVWETLCRGNQKQRVECHGINYGNQNIATDRQTFISSVLKKYVDNSRYRKAWQYWGPSDTTSDMCSNLPLSQFAHDRFKTVCDRKFNSSYVMSLPLHDASHLFYARKWSHRVASDFWPNSEATLGDSNCCIGSQEHSHNVVQRCVNSQ